MAATVEIHEMTGASAGTDKTSGTVRFKSADEQSVDTTNRLQIPDSGWFYSYHKQLRFYIEVAPSVDISNLQFYSDGSATWSSINLEYDKQASWGANACDNIGGTDVFTITSGSPGTLAASSATYATTGYCGRFLRLQMSVHSTAAPGQLATERITFSYDET